MRATRDRKQTFSRHGPSLVIGFVLLSLLALTSSPSADTRLEYQKRGNRYEGIKPRPVSGYDIELIAALVDYKEEANQIPDRIKVLFYLERPSEVHLIVRELDYKYYYWMDKVQPNEPWRPGTNNIFEWPTQDVLRELKEVTLYDLGVVARLQKPDPGKIEQVAPAILYHSRLPAARKRYLFTFKASGNARLTASVYREGEKTGLFTQIFQRQPGGRPFTVRWSAMGLAGSYRLVVTGYFLDTNVPIDQVVNFYHHPDVK